MFLTDGANNVGNQFTNGPPATQVNADWLNMLQNELATILTAASVTPNKPDSTQVLAALKLIFSTLPHFALSDDCGSFSTSSTSEVAVTNLSATITCQGRPVLVTVQPGIANNAAIYKAGTSDFGVILAYRGATLLGAWQIGTGATFQLPASLQVVDTSLPTGSQTFAIHAFVYNGSDALHISGCKLLVCEL